MQSIRILIVDDDSASVALLSDVLDEPVWVKYVARDGEEGLRVFFKERPDLTILDLGIPKVDGFEVCRRIRESCAKPIVVLSGRRSPDDKIKCFSLGADDYVTKPFDVRELIARLQAVLRRAKQPALGDETSRYVDDDLTINFDSREVNLGSKKVILTVTEFAILRELVGNVGKVLTYGQLLRRVWGDNFELEREYLHVHMGHLRSKIESRHGDAQRIVTVRGIGYMLRRGVNGQVVPSVRPVFNIER